MKIQILIENKTERPDCAAEHGLSIYIEAQGHRILFDSGASPKFIDNAKNLGVDLTEVDEAIISHGHYDHTGGFPEFCRMNSKAVIYVHRDAFEDTYGMKNGQIEQRRCGILWSQEEKKKLATRLYLTNRVHWISEDIAVSGTIPDLLDTEAPKNFYIKRGLSTYEPDPMNHEQILVIREKEGLYIFSGCSHKGIIPAIRYGKDIFPGEKVAGVIAGLHLYHADEERRLQVAEQLLAEDVDMVMPLHCTGLEAICQIKNQLKERCILASAGTVYESI